MNRFRALFMGFATAAAAGGLAAYNGLFSTASEPAISEAAKPAVTAEKPVEVAKVDPAAPVVETPAEKPAATAKVTDPAPATEAAPAAAAIAPAFDTLRVEPDGSLLVSGQTQSNADVELMNGSTVLGKVKAGASGDFAIVLDEPLKPGDYALVLRTTNPDGKVATSVQTATVSVPEAKTGQVLALVEEPGKASRIISAPVADKPEDVAVAEPAAAEPAKAPEAVAATPAAEPEKPAAATAQPEKPAETAAAEPAPAAEPAEPEETVAVEAVEIEGKKIFIAGQAKAGSTIRLYANGDILGETKATENNRFLLEIERELAVGDYAISAEMLDANGQQVMAKAVVPFKREAGEEVVAVAPQAPKTEDVAEAQAAQPADAVKADGSSQAEVVATAEVPATSEAATAPALQKVDTSVIIRRGDSLWRISRRIYGRGVRYSTIYLANKEKVSNPNRIWPGQVMMIPEKTPEGEAADMAEIEKRKAGSTQQ